MTVLLSIRRLDASEAISAIPALADVLIDCVHAGASVSFQPPLEADRAQAFWRKVAAAVYDGTTILIVAEDAGRLLGTVQVVFATSENQPHRADVAKMLVHTAARRSGVGAQLMGAAENAAKAAGKTLLTLDTHTGSSGERLYARLGWTAVGVVPGYALTPYDGLCDTTIFYKKIA